MVDETANTYERWLETVEERKQETIPRGRLVALLSDRWSMILCAAWPEADITVDLDAFDGSDPWTAIIIDLDQLKRITKIDDIAEIEARVQQLGGLRLIHPDNSVAGPAEDILELFVERETVGQTTISRRPHPRPVGS